MKIPFAMLLVFFLLFGCTKQAGLGQQVSLKTKDGYDISATYYANGTSDKALILLHMFSSDKESWKDYAPEFVGAGYDVLAIDMRGHGESTGSYHLFAQADFNRMLFDVKAAADYLRANGTKNISIMGGSLGANVGLKYASRYGGVDKVVLLSPGLEYKWVNIEEEAEKYDGDVLIIVSKEDVYSAKSSNRLKDLLGPNAKLEVYEGFGHGTDMLKGTHLVSSIIVWLGS